MYNHSRPPATYLTSHISPIYFLAIWWSWPRTWMTTSALDLQVLWNIFGDPDYFRFCLTSLLFGDIPHPSWSPKDIPKTDSSSPWCPMSSISSISSLLLLLHYIIRVKEQKGETFCSMLRHWVISCGAEWSTVVSRRSQTAPTSSGMRVIRCIGRVRNDDRGRSWHSAADSRRLSVYWNASFCCLRQHQFCHS